MDKLLSEIDALKDRLKKKDEVFRQIEEAKSLDAATGLAWEGMKI